MQPLESNIPILKTFYKKVKEVMKTLNKGDSLVEFLYPRFKLIEELNDADDLIGILEDFSLSLNLKI